MSTSSSFLKLEPRLSGAAGVLARAAAAKAKAGGIDLQPLLREVGITRNKSTTADNGSTREPRSHSSRRSPAP